MKLLTLTAFIMVFLTFTPRISAAGRTNCTELSVFHSPTTAFCGSFFGDHGGQSDTVLCIPNGNGTFSIGGFYIMGNLTEEQNYYNCQQAAAYRNLSSNGNPIYKLPFPASGELQCINSGYPNDQNMYARLMYLGVQVGEILGTRECVDAVKKSSDQLVCAMQEDGMARVVKYKQGELVNEYAYSMSFYECTRGLGASKTGRVCASDNDQVGRYWKKFNSDGRYVGFFRSLAQCAEWRDAI